MAGARWSFDSPHACYPPPSKAPLMRRTPKPCGPTLMLELTQSRFGVRCDSTAFPSVHFRRRWSPGDSRGSRHRQECLCRRPRLTESVGSAIMPRIVPRQGKWKSLPLDSMSGVMEKKVGKLMSHDDRPAEKQCTQK